MVGLFHPTLITLGAWVIGGAALIICKGEAICYLLFFVVGVILIIRVWGAVTGDLYNVVDMIVCLDNFPGKEGAPQGLVLFYRFCYAQALGVVKVRSLSVKDIA